MQDIARGALQNSAYDARDWTVSQLPATALLILQTFQVADTETDRAPHTPICCSSERPRMSHLAAIFPVITDHQQRHVFLKQRSSSAGSFPHGLLSPATRRPGLLPDPDLPRGDLGGGDED